VGKCVKKEKLEEKEGQKKFSQKESSALTRSSPREREEKVVDFGSEKHERAKRAMSPQKTPPV